MGVNLEGVGWWKRVWHARCVSHTLKECVGHHTLTKIFVCGTLEFSKIAHWNFEKWVWGDDGGGCNVAVPNLPRREAGWGDVYWLALGPSVWTSGGKLGTATLQPPPASSHTHFSEFQWAIFGNSSVPHTKIFVRVWDTTHSLSVWETQRDSKKDIEGRRNGF